MIEPSTETIPSGPARCPAASSTKTADESASHCTRPLARSSGIRRRILPSIDSKTSAFVGPPLPPWDLEISVVPSGESSGKSPDALSGAAGLRLAVDDAPAGQVVWRELNLDPIAWVDPDPIPAHPPGRVAERLVPVIEDDSVLAAPERLDDCALDLDLFFLFRHISSESRLAAARNANWESSARPIHQ